MTLPTNQDFATEVKFDRLRLLWRVTLIGAVLGGWVFLNIAMLQRIDVLRALVPLLVVAVGMIVTRFILRYGGYTAAAWVYVFSGLIALGIGMIFAEDTLLYVIPFTFPLMIFIVGLLLAPANTLVIALISAVIILIAPIIGGHAADNFGSFQIAAVIMTFISAIIAAQVAGDLYSIADWAMSNYQRERRIAGELFENRQALEKSLARSTALSARLQETNDELDTARGAAEEAKHFRGQFLANMSHELRTPLNAIIGFSETMLKFPAMYEEITLPVAYEADLQQIYTSGRQLLTLINDILDLAKVDAGKLDVRMERVDLHTVFSNVVSTAHGLVGNKPITLETDIPDVLPEVWADEARVRQVLLNLYSNAAKFTEHGSITLTVNEIDDGVQISMKDTGIGIAPRNLGVIFEEFKQADTGGRDPRSGAGLGLAISRQLMALMGGHIWAESEVGVGSTFYMTLQAYHDAPVAAPVPVMVEERQ